MWQQNLMGNLLTLGIFLGLFIIIWCKIKNQTLLDVIRDVKEGLADE